VVILRAYEYETSLHDHVTSSTMRNEGALRNSGAVEGVADVFETSFIDSVGKVECKKTLMYVFYLTPNK
jgi:hypothetical protein